MTVRELIAKLAKMDQDLQVRILDTYWDEEGWGEDRSKFEYLYPLLKEVEVRAEKGSVLLRVKDEA